MLEKNLEQMTRLSVPQLLAWELLIVDNGSSDATNDVVHSFADRLPVRLVREPVPGLSHARNRAVREAAGTYIVWADDDVLVSKTWLSGYCEAFDRWPEAVVFGGHIEPWWEGDPPRWLARVWQHIPGAFSLRDLGDEPLPLAADDALVPFGGNFAIRTETQRSYPYDPALGLQPAGRWLRGEETEVIKAVLGDGYEGFWIPDARVYHWIPKEQQSLRFVRGVYYGLGQTASLTAPTGTLDEFKLFGKPLWLYREALEAELKYRVARSFSAPESWIIELIKSSTAWGKLRGSGVRPETADPGA